MEEKKRRDRQGFATCYGTFVFNGALALSIGALLPYIRDSYGLSYAFVGLLVSLHSVGNLLSSFAGGMLPLAIGRRKSILCFTACYSVSFLMILLTHSPAVLFVAFLMTGLARGAVSNFNNTEINMLAPGKGWAINALHACFAVGAFGVPMLVLLCAQVLGRWQLMCIVLIVFGVVEVLLYAVMPMQDKLVSTAGTKNNDMGFLHEQNFWLTLLTLFFYLCAEQGVIGWMVTYFQDSGIMSAGFAQTMATVLWIMILAGRLTAAWLCTRFDKAWLLFAMASGMVVFFIIVLLGKTLPVITLGIAGFGFTMAGVYPTSVSMSGEVIGRYPLSWSVILTCASLGSILMPSIVGAVVEGFGLFAGISTIMLAVLATLGITLLTLVLNRRKNTEA